MLKAVKFLEEMGAVVEEAKPEGLPIGVQVVANLRQDHLALAAAKALETHFLGGQLPALKISEKQQKSKLTPQVL